jgi:hypothetical protein
MLMSQDDAKKTMNDFRAAVQTSTWSQDVDTAVNTYQAVALSFSKIGDETFATRLNITSRSKQFGNEVSGQVDYIVWRRGPLVNFIFTRLGDSAAMTQLQAAKADKIFVKCPEPAKKSKSKKKKTSTTT